MTHCNIKKSNWKGQITKANTNDICEETGRVISKGEHCLYLPQKRLKYHIESLIAKQFLRLLG